MSTTSLSNRVLSHFKSDFDSSYALSTLIEACSGDCYLVGGAIRDVACGVAGCGDLDVVVPNDDHRAYKALELLGVPFELNSHGNPRYRWNRLQLDVFEPKNFFSGFSTVQDALGFFDLRINALAIHLGSGALLDPIKGFECLDQSRVGINWPRWDAMPSEEIMVLLIRLVRVLHDVRVLRLERQDANRLLEEVIPRVIDLDWHSFEHRFPPGKDRFFGLLYSVLNGESPDFHKRLRPENRPRPVTGNAEYLNEEATHDTLRSVYFGRTV